MLSFGGLLGYLGVNSDGLAIGLNLVLGGDWRPGLPPYLAIRHLLDQAGSVAEALAILPGLPLASSRSLTLCDSGSVACAEIVDNELRLVEPGGEIGVHTNHLLHPDLTPRDALNVFARNSSRLRLTAGQAALAELTELAVTGPALGPTSRSISRGCRGRRSAWPTPATSGGSGPWPRSSCCPTAASCTSGPVIPSRSATQSFRIDVAVRQ